MTERDDHPQGSTPRSTPWMDGPGQDIRANAAGDYRGHFNMHPVEAPNVHDDDATVPVPVGAPDAIPGLADGSYESSVVPPARDVPHYDAEPSRVFAVEHDEDSCDEENPTAFAAPPKTRRPQTSRHQPSAGVAGLAALVNTSVPQTGDQAIAQRARSALTGETGRQSPVDTERDFRSGQLGVAVPPRRSSSWKTRVVGAGVALAGIGVAVYAISLITSGLGAADTQQATNQIVASATTSPAEPSPELDSPSQPDQPGTTITRTLAPIVATPGMEETQKPGSQEPGAAPKKPSNDKPGTGDGPKPDQPKPDQPKPDQPKPDRPKPDQPKPDRPKPDQPKPDQPKPDRPKPDQPKPEQPKPGPVDGSGQASAVLGSVNSVRARYGYAGLSQNGCLAGAAKKGATVMLNRKGHVSLDPRGAVRRCGFSRYHIDTAVGSKAAAERKFLSSRKGLYPSLKAAGPAMMQDTDGRKYWVIIYAG